MSAGKPSENPGQREEHQCEPLYCDCCGKEKMAELRDGKLVILSRKHGRRHVLIITPLTTEKSVL